MIHLLLLMHIVGDFLVQNDNDVKEKETNVWIGNTIHLAKTYLVYVLFAIVLVAITDGSISDLPMLMLRVLILVLMHFGIDLLKGLLKWMTSKNIWRLAEHNTIDIWGFVIDQILHVLTLFVVVMMFEWDFDIEAYLPTIILMNALLISTFVGHEFIRLFLSVHCPEYDGDVKNFKTAKSIGVLERLIMTPAFIYGIYEAVLAVVAIKVFTGYKRSEQADDTIVSRNAFILGNLLSIVMVMVGTAYYLFSI